MKKAGMILSSFAMVLFFASMSLAAGSNTLTVQANVLGTCKFSSGTSLLDFLTLDPSNPVVVNVSTSTNFWCTKGVTTDVITATNGANFSGGSRNMKHATLADLIPYTLTLVPDGAANTGPASPRTLTLNGSVVAAAYTGVSAGSYSDTVILNITP